MTQIEVGSHATQLDENGMMPCGCGGKACLWERKSGRGWLADCLKCDMGTDADELSKAEAKAMWNAAMGWKE